ncbi:hypothetical protein T11_4436 [Trichinella zimbabwensis]|uniref:Uncharacterized protein n=1 Tax=Trichinella zimbabwensis TaxID=268475 RepID=A0A0V1I2Z7_9BILA|nr:hypothetical protein T11_4436 [Trichinella zimbabwensis]
MLYKWSRDFRKPAYKAGKRAKRERTNGILLYIVFVLLLSRVVDTEPSLMLPSNPGSNSAENGKRGRINGSEWVRSPEILTKLSDVEARFEHMCNRRPGAQYPLQKKSHRRNKNRQMIIRKCAVIRDYQIRYGSELVKRVVNEKAGVSSVIIAHSSQLPALLAELQGTS